MRGIAALVVVVHHALLTSPPLASAYVAGDAPPIAGSFAWWLIWSPLHLAWAGHEAVILFFVLSGLVLALPWAEHRPPTWSAYYRKRLARLYLPVTAAVLIGYALIQAGLHTHSGGGSAWLAGHPATVTWREALSDAALLGHPGVVNSALWSLKWEVLFSALLPLYVWTASRMAPLAAVAALAVLYQGRSAEAAFLPLFLLGTSLAFWRPLSALTRPIVTRGLALVAVTLLLAEWWHWPHVRALAGLGAFLLVMLTAHTSVFRAWLTTRPAQWLGSRSFSLYLVHEPIVVACAFVAGGTPHLAWFVPAMIALACLAAEAFFRAVELPSIAVAKRFGAMRVHAVAHRLTDPISQAAFRL